MRFDDRLLTVLNQPAGDRHDRAIRWRQLVDLVARAGANAGSPLIERAIQTIREDAPRVEEPLRAAAARAIAAVPLPLGLLEYFASDRLSVSAPILAAANLELGQWDAVLQRTDEETRGFIEALHPELRQAQPDFTEQLVAPEEALAPSLHDVVERIERRRRTRAAMQGRGQAGVVSRDSSPSLFRWECGPGGEINWVEGAPRGPLIGRSIARAPTSGGDLIDSEVVRSFTMRAPFRDAILRLGGDAAVSGEWKISGVPAFEPSDGRFAGYRGIALREQDGAPEGPATELLPDADSVRELVHEIKTPLTAIIGFAEIIEGQYLGPAERVYRERAQEIVSQARLLLAAIDDLDFVARIHSASVGKPRVNLGELIERITPALREMASSRSVEIDGGSQPGRESLAAAEPELADRLIFRLCSAVIGQASPGERLRLVVEPVGDRWRVSIGRPGRLSRLSEEELFGADATVDGGFPLRLVRGLAKSAGAELVAMPGTLSLIFARA